MTKHRERLTAEPITETVKVSHPRLEGHIEIVQRVMDTLSTMLKRKQLKEREYLAGDRIRSAQEKLYGSPGGAMDFERVRGGGLPGAAPAISYLIAADIMAETKRYLYPQDYAVVHRICALGMTIEQTAAHLYKPARRAQREDCGRRLREGLAQMADRWFPEHRGRGGNMRSFSTERAMPTDLAVVEPGRVHLGELTSPVVKPHKSPH